MNKIINFIRYILNKNYLRKEKIIQDKNKINKNDKVKQGYPVLPLFSKPVFYKKLDPITDELRNKILNIEFTPVKSQGPAGTNGFISKNERILHEKDFSILLEQIQREVDFYTYNVLKVSKNIKFKITGSWIMKHTDEAHQAMPHVHTGAVLSGCLYLKAQRNCGNIILMDFNSAYASKALPFPFKFNFEKLNIYNSPTWEFEVENDILILFPSDIVHATGNNLSGEARYCLAFDVIPEGEFGGRGSGRAQQKVNVKYTLCEN